MTSYITAIGTALPERRASQEEAGTLIADAMELSPKQKKILHWMYKKAAIDYRHSVVKGFSEQKNDNTTLSLTASTATRMRLYELYAKPLATKAIQNGIPQEKLATISHLITVSCTGMYAPGLGIDLIKAFDLPRTIKRSAINFMGCYSTFPALRLANSICTADPDAKVLIVGVELCTLHLQKEYNEDNLFASAIFSDGAGALLVESQPTAASNLKLNNFYSNIIPDEDNNMAWYIRDLGFDMKLSAYIPHLLNTGIRPLLNGLFESLRIKKSEIDYYAIHPGGKKILESIEDCLEIESKKNQQAHEVLRACGNMSSVTITFVLQKILQNMQQQESINNILTMAFGPGLTLEAALLETCYV